MTHLWNILLASLLLLLMLTARRPQLRLALPVLLLVVLGPALAQTFTPPVNVGNVVIPDYIWTIATLVIGWLVKEISSPITALLKRRYGFQGSVTQYVYLLITTLFVAGFGLVSGAFGGGSAGWYAALGALAVALVKGFGDYARLQQAAAASSPQIVVTAAPQVLHPVGTPGTEPLHDADGFIVGAVKPLTPSNPQVVVSGLEPAK